MGGAFIGIIAAFEKKRLGLKGVYLRGGVFKIRLLMLTKRFTFSILKG